MYKILAGVGSIVRTLWMVFTHVGRKRDTILYPEVPAEQIVPPRYRGRIILTRDRMVKSVVLPATCVLSPVQ